MGSSVYMAREWKYVSKLSKFKGQDYMHQCERQTNKQTDNIKLNLMESIISEQASFVTCVRVCEEGRNKTLAYSIFPQILPLNHDDKL